MVWRQSHQFHEGVGFLCALIRWIGLGQYLVEVLAQGQLGIEPLHRVLKGHREGLHAQFAPLGFLHLEKIHPMEEHLAPCFSLWGEQTGDGLDQ